jgi:hypothetical protein
MWAVHRLGFVAHVRRSAQVRILKPSTPLCIQPRRKGKEQLMGVLRTCCLTIGLVCVATNSIATAQISDKQELTWGDDDGKTLYLCARTGLYRMRLNIPGLQP